MKYSIFDAMNFKTQSPLLAAIFSMLFFSAFSMLFSSCSALKDTPDPKGDLTVQTPISENVSGTIQYRLQNVVLKNVSSLREVNGKYATFYYAPGIQNGRLSGFSPIAFFMKMASNVFVPKDDNSIQMATIYYHMQNLIQFAQNLKAMDINSAAFPVGLSTRVKQDTTLQANNAFFDGRSQAMLFVPYTANEMPIAVNAGIVAHEFFHSIFYRYVFAKMSSAPTAGQNISHDTVHVEEGWRSAIVGEYATDPISSTVKTDQELYNETYLRGINEGMADFWAWAYTKDPDFLKWSLSSYAANRTLQKQATPTYLAQSDIMRAVQEAQFEADNPSLALSGYIYNIGTPYARFLKEVVETKAKNESKSLDDAKSEVCLSLVSFIDKLGTSAANVSGTATLPIDDLFMYFSDTTQGAVSQDQCNLAINYLNSAATKPAYKCGQDNASASFKVIKL